MSEIKPLPTNSRRRSNGNFSAPNRELKTPNLELNRRMPRMTEAHQNTTIKRPITRSVKMRSNTTKIGKRDCSEPILKLGLFCGIM
jgi:hypothetical protein